ncbi:MAG: ATP-binding protein [Desulfobacca sp.]|nr:ATP-binding protein [Desulfobacca sp.]
MPILSEIVLPAKLEHLQKFLHSILGCAREQGLSDKRINEIELVAEEALVNIFNYAYREKEGEVEVICRTDQGRPLIIEIIDSGLPFNPLSKEDPDLKLDIAERKIGGLGVYLMKTLMDQVHYQREDDKNILTLIVNKIDSYCQ